MTTTEIDNDEVVLTYDESYYYEERSSAEEIYIEFIVEELRSKLISETPDTAVESYCEVLANLFHE